MKILFAGGCHVVGYPVGEEHAFPVIVRTALEGAGVPCEIRCVPYLPLHRPERLEEGCHGFHPDAVVLQLGNFELGNELFRYLCSRIAGKKPSSRSKHTPSGKPPGKLVAGTVRAWLKRGIDALLGHPLVDYVMLEKNLDIFLSAATRFGAESVTLMSPTPCFDPTALYYRRRAVPLFQNAARRHNCAFVDLVSLMPPRSQSVGRDGFFVDGIHLGIAGHVAVASSVVEQLKGAAAQCRR